MSDCLGIVRAEGGVGAWWWVLLGGKGEGVGLEGVRGYGGEGGEGAKGVVDWG